MKVTILPPKIILKQLSLMMPIIIPPAKQSKNHRLRMVHHSEKAKMYDLKLNRKRIIGVRSDKKSDKFFANYM